jgi:hypothetical protein
MCNMQIKDNNIIGGHKMKTCGTANVHLCGSGVTVMTRNTCILPNDNNSLVQNYVLPDLC